MKKIVSLIALVFSFASFATTAPQVEKAVSLLKKLDSSDYGTRTVCIVGTNVYGIVPGRHWSESPSFAEGNLNSFPQKITVMYSIDQIPVSIKSSEEKLISDVKGVKLMSAPGIVKGMKADVCVYESKVVFE